MISGSIADLNVIAGNPRQNCEAILRWSDGPSTLAARASSSRSPTKRRRAKAEAIHSVHAARWLASWSLSSGAH
jgi:hypothetical protein